MLSQALDSHLNGPVQLSTTIALCNFVFALHLEAKALKALE